VIRSFVVSLFWLAFGVLVVSTAIGLVTLWPEDRTIEQPLGLARPKTLGAEIVAIAAAPCRVPGLSSCRTVTVELKEGKDAGKRATMTVNDPPDRLDLDVGDGVRVAENQLPPEAQLGGVKLDRYSLADFERKAPLLWLGLAFAALVLVTGRWEGLRALIGLAVSLAIVVVFVVPAILDGSSPPGVALIGSLAIMLVTLGLGSLFIGLAHLTGLSSDEALFLRASVGDISITGLLLAGMVIGALGVLDDLTVTQASTVLALRRANPSLGFRRLFEGAIAVGHDHIAATVNTLVLAYAGAALPVLLIFSLGGTSFGDAINSESVATEVVATLVGSIGLIAAVPLTTALAAFLAVRLAPASLPDEHAGHAH
jgi:uncharacterized membrane protein